MSTVRAKALNYLRDEDVRILSAATPVGLLRPSEVTACVRGHRGHHHVRFDAGVWTCTCPDGDGCAHVAAVQPVTGWQGAASKGGA